MFDERCLFRVSGEVGLGNALGIFSLLVVLLTAASAFAQTTPIKHLVVVVGENTSFDTLFATYRGAEGKVVRNLLSQGIVNADGTPGPNFARALQKSARSTGRYEVDFVATEPIPSLPRPHARADKGARKLPDEKIPEGLPPGPFQITRYRPYAEYTDSNPVHRFFQMWQQVNGGRNDLFLWTGLTSGEGAKDRNAPGKGTYYGSEALGFYNMAAGDVPYFSELAREYALADNYHQAVMGGTMPNYFFLATGDVARYLDGGKPVPPPENQVENPDPLPGTANWYSNSGYRSGSYTLCADHAQPGVAAIRRYLDALPYKAFNGGNCEADTYYLVNNYTGPHTYNGARKPSGASDYMATPQALPTIASQLAAAGIDWKWYHGGREGARVRKGEYTSDTDPLTFVTTVVESNARQRLVSDDDFFADAERELPAVSFISPPITQTGHPHYGSPERFEAYVRRVVEKLKGNPALWANTAVFVTYDEGGGYYDSGYVQAIDFFGDGTRIPLLVVSPWARKGHVEHTYYDHASIHKFIQRNWKLKPLSGRTRDNLPNPTHVADPYVPDNRPAIGDLFEMFDFQAKPARTK